MRMWMIEPELMCGNHRSGEHGEIHKHMKSLIEGKSVEGRFNPVVQIQLNALQSRHDELALTLNHKSPITVPETTIRNNYPQYYSRTVNKEENIKDLCDRCPKCKKLIRGEI